MTATQEQDEAEESGSGKGARRSGERVIRKVPAVSRAIAILRLLGRSSEPLGVNRIARELGLVPSTALHILRVLMSEELVSFDERTKRYQLDMGVLTIARSALRRNSFVNAVQPELDRLAREFNVTMLAAKLVGLEHSIVVATSHSNQPIRLHTDIGSRYPALVSATGRCLAAFGHYKRSELAKHFAKLQWANAVTFEDWLEQVEQTRRDGYGIDEGNFLTGVSIVAVPVMDDGQMKHSLVAVGLNEQIASIGVSNLVREMQNAVSDVMERITDSDY